MMIRKLRAKFVLINMLLVTLVLLIVFGALCFANYQRLETQSQEAMRQALQHTGGQGAPKPEIAGKDFQGKPPQKPRSMVPVFCVTLDSQLEINQVFADNVEVSDLVVRQAVDQVLTQRGGSQALEAEQPSGSEQAPESEQTAEAPQDSPRFEASPPSGGTLSDLNLRYLWENTPSGSKIAFADRSWEKESMLSTLATSFFVGLAGLSAFFLISLFLSYWALRPVERAWEQQRQFVADASHELKTPLTVILANTGILLSHQDDPIKRQVKWVEYIQAEAQRMKQLVEDLLFLAKSDAAKSTLKKSSAPASPPAADRLNFSDLVWSSLLPFESLAFEQGVSLDSEIESDLYLNGNEAQLKQLVAILLDNACKYAGSGGAVHLTLKRTDHRKQPLLLAVRNTGDPIPPEQLPYLFERFYRADESRVRTQGGYGLGLSIAKSIVEAHHGKLKVESTRETGTTFLVQLQG